MQVRKKIWSLCPVVQIVHQLIMTKQTLLQYSVQVSLVGEDITILSPPHYYHMEPLFLIMGCRIYCCAIFSYCPSTVVNASLIFISVYLKQQHAVVVVVVVFPAEVVLYISVTTEVCLPLQVCTLVLWSSIPLCSLSVAYLIFSWFQQGSCLSWRMYEGRDMILSTKCSTNFAILTF